MLTSHKRGSIAEVNKGIGLSVANCATAPFSKAGRPKGELARGDVAHNEARTFFKGKQKESGCASAALAIQHFKTVAWYADGMDNPGAPGLVKKANGGIKDVTKLQKKKKCSITT